MRIRSASRIGTGTFARGSAQPEREQNPMKCPLCNVELVMSERQGIEIDYCPQCRGVWLDRGELDKIVDRSNSQFAPSAAPYEDSRYAGEDRYDKRRYDEHTYRDGRRFDERRPGDYDKRIRKKKKPESFLSDLFDFGD